jgi:hypothetical protein
MGRMADLLEDMLRYCSVALLDLRDTETRRTLAARLAILERATWSMAVTRAPKESVSHLAKLVLDLRDDVAREVAR